MNLIKPEQCLQIVIRFYQNNGSVRQTYRSLRPFLYRASERLIQITMECFQTTFTFNDDVHPL